MLDMEDALTRVLDASGLAVKISNLTTTVDNLASTLNHIAKQNAISSAR